MRQAPIIELLKTGTSGVSNFAIDQALKDMSLMVALARTEAIDSPIINAAQTTAQESADGGWGVKTSLCWPRGVNTKRPKLCVTVKYLSLQNCLILSCTLKLPTRILTLNK